MFKVLAGVLCWGGVVLIVANAFANVLPGADAVRASEVYARWGLPLAVVALAAYLVGWRWWNAEEELRRYEADDPFETMCARVEQLAEAVWALADARQDPPAEPELSTYVSAPPVVSVASRGCPAVSVLTPSGTVAYRQLPGRPQPPRVNVSDPAAYDYGAAPDPDLAATDDLPPTRISPK